MAEANNGQVRIHTPDEIAERAGRITIKTLSAFIRSRGLETTTLGHAPPSRKGGPPRRLWGMTDAQLECLLAVTEALRSGTGPGDQLADRLSLAELDRPAGGRGDVFLGRVETECREHRRVHVFDGRRPGRVFDALGIGLADGQAAAQAAAGQCQAVAVRPVVAAAPSG